MTLQETAPSIVPESHLLRFISNEDRANYPVATTQPMTGWWIVTPEVATAWLESNTDNFRPLNGDNAEELRGEMERGAWIPNPSPVSFVKGTGVLADGQHRLSALASSDVAIVLHVYTETLPQAVDKLDIGRKRTAANILARHGMAEPKIAASVARFLFLRHHKLQCGGALNSGKVAEFALGLHGLADASKRAVTLHQMQAKKMLRPTAMGFFLFLERSQGADSMVEACCSLAGLSEGESPYALVRKRIALENRSMVGLQTDTAFAEVADICTAWDYFKNSVPCKLLKTQSKARWFYLPGIDFTVSNVRRYQLAQERSA